MNATGHGSVDGTSIQSAATTIECCRAQTVGPARPWKRAEICVGKSTTSVKGSGMTDCPLTLSLWQSQLKDSSSPQFQSPQLQRYGAGPRCQKNPCASALTSEQLIFFDFFCAFPVLKSKCPRNRHSACPRFTQSIRCVGMTSLILAKLGTIFERFNFDKAQYLSLLFLMILYIYHPNSQNDNHGLFCIALIFREICFFRGTQAKRRKILNTFLETHGSQNLSLNPDSSKMSKTSTSSFNHKRTKTW
jgi:hypothetical protein